MTTTNERTARRPYRPPTRNSRLTDLPHNPYVGFFHRNNRLSFQQSSSRVFLPNSSPHVGTFRHAPAHSQRLKDLMWEDDSHLTPFISQLQLAKQVLRRYIPTLTSLLLLISQNKYADRHIAKNALDEIPMSTFSSKKEVNEEDAPICLICLEAFVNGDELRNLKCSHCFHRACVDIWLLGTLSEDSVVTSICPTCRQDAGSSSSSSSCSSSQQGGVSGSAGGIPPEIFLRIGQHLLEEGSKGFGGTPSPLNLSPMLSPPPATTHSPLLPNTSSQQAIIRTNRFSPRACQAVANPVSTTPSSEIGPSPTSQALASALLAVVEEDENRHARARSSSLSSLSSASVSSGAVSSIDEDTDDVNISFMQINHADLLGMSIVQEETGYASSGSEDGEADDGVFYLSAEDGDDDFNCAD